MDGITGIVIATIVALVTIIVAVARAVTEKNRCERDHAIKQTELGVKLANIEKELIEIKAMMTSALKNYENVNKEIAALDKRIMLIEQKR